MRILRGLRKKFFIPGSCATVVYGSGFCCDLLAPFGNSRTNLEKQKPHTPTPGRHAVLLANLGPVAPKKGGFPSSLEPQEVKQYVETEWKRDNVACLESLLFFLEAHTAVGMNKILLEHLDRTNKKMEIFAADRVTAYDIHYGECVHLAIFSSVRFTSAPPPRA